MQASGQVCIILAGLLRLSCTYQPVRCAPFKDGTSICKFHTLISQLSPRVLILQTPLFYDTVRHTLLNSQFCIYLLLWLNLLLFVLFQHRQTYKNVAQQYVTSIAGLVGILIVFSFYKVLYNLTNLLILSRYCGYI